MNLKSHIAHLLVALLGLCHFLYVDIAYAAINPPKKNVHKRRRNKCIYFQLSEALRDEIAKAPQTDGSYPKPLCLIFDKTSVTEAPIVNLNFSYLEIPEWATKIKLSLPTSQGIKEFFIDPDDLEEIKTFSQTKIYKISLVQIDNYPMYICIDNITSIIEHKNSIIEQAQEIENQDTPTDTPPVIQQRTSTTKETTNDDYCWLQYCMDDDSPSFSENPDGSTSDY